MGKRVGFDFGTHQTKICFADDSDPWNVQYSFMDFVNPYTSKRTPCFPSIVQINTDHTLSYGFYDPAKCLTETYDLPVTPPDYKPMPIAPSPLPPEPVYKEDKKKKKIENGSLKDQLSLLLSASEKNRKSPAYEQWEKEHQAYLKKKALWEIANNKYIEEKEAVDAWNAEQYRIYNKALAERTRTVIHRYDSFKYKTFIRSEHEDGVLLEPYQTSLLYITYIVFLLEEKWGQTFSLQFGLPSSPDTYYQQRSFATRLITTAYHIVEEVFNNDLERFLKTPYEQLLQYTELLPFDEDKKYELGIMVLPESCACLNTLVEAGKIKESRVSLLVDIGGGTTDISLFTVNGKDLNLYKFVSVPKGLNFIKNEGDTESYIIAIDDCIRGTMKDIWEEFIAKQLPKSEYYKILNGNTIIYNGGGSTKPELRIDYQTFKTVLHISRDMFSSEMDVDYFKELCPILSNSYGLAHEIENDTEVKLKPFDVLFKEASIQIHSVEKKSRLDRMDFDD